MTKLESKYISDIIAVSINSNGYKFENELFFKLYSEICENIKGFKIVKSLSIPFIRDEKDHFVFFKNNAKKTVFIELKYY